MKNIGSRDDNTNNNAELYYALIDHKSILAKTPAIVPCLVLRNAYIVINRGSYTWMKLPKCFDDLPPVAQC